MFAPYLSVMSLSRHFLCQLLLLHAYKYPINFFVLCLSFIYYFSFFFSPHPYLPLTIPAR